METKNIINIPEGFEVDKEQSTERQIVLRKIDNRASLCSSCTAHRLSISYFFAKNRVKICICQKKAVPLHPIS